MSGTVWSKFFWSDWQADPALRNCSYAARGLWMDMLCIAAAHDPIGYVSVAGRGLDETAIARMTGGSESEARALLGELEQNGVFSRDRRGTIYSRRLVSDARKAAIARKNGKEGGNPSLSKQTHNSASDKGNLKPPLKPQEPLSTSQRPKKKDNALARFDEFWNACPKKTARGAAEKAWPKALAQADADTLIAAMKTYAATQAGKEAAYIKTPGPWLNEKRWLDDGIAPKATLDVASLREQRDRAARLNLPTDRIDRAIEEAEARAA